MRNGKDVAQLDKAGSLGLELIHLYKIKGDPIFLNAAVKIANTLAPNVTAGNNEHSPLPFKVNVYTGKTVLLNVTGKLYGNSKDTACYTSNLTPALQMFLDLAELKKGNVASYQAASSKIIAWIKKYPAKTNKWGLFLKT